MAEIVTPQHLPRGPVFHGAGLCVCDGRHSAGVSKKRRVRRCAERNPGGFRRQFGRATSRKAREVAHPQSVALSGRERFGVYLLLKIPTRHVAQFLDAIPFGPHIEIIEALARCVVKHSRRDAAAPVCNFVSPRPKLAAQNLV